MRWYGFVVLFIVCSFFCNLLYVSRLAYMDEEPVIVKKMSLPQSELKILDAPERPPLSAQTTPEQPLMLFFFASWCRPCRMEMPEIVKLSERHDVPFIGVAVKDNPKRLRALLKKTGDPYQFIALDTEMKWAEELDATRLPTAFILNGKREIVAKINTFVTEEFYLEKILPFLQELKNETSY